MFIMNIIILVVLNSLNVFSKEFISYTVRQLLPENCKSECQWYAKNANDGRDNDVHSLDDG